MAGEKIIAGKLTLDGGQANDTVKNFKQQLKEANNELLNTQAQFGATSDQALAAARRVAELRDAIGEANEVAGLFDPGAKFQAFGNVLKTVTGGFSAITGAMALFGEESKEVEQALLKVQSALALTEGVNTILDSAKDFERMKAVALDAFKSIKAAIGSTGIGLIVLAVGALVTYWDDIKELVGGVSEEQKKLLELSKENLKAEQGKLDTIGSQDNVLKLQGKSEREILQTKIKQTDEVIKATEQVINQERINAESSVKAAQRNKEFLQGLIDFITLPIRLLFEYSAKAINGIIDVINKIPGVDIDVKINGKAIEELNEKAATYFFDPKKVQEEINTTIAEQQKGIDKLKNDRAGYQLAINEIGKKEVGDAQTNKDALNKIDEQRKKERIQYLAEMQALQEERITKADTAGDAIDNSTATINAATLAAETNASIQQQITDSEKAAHDKRLQNYNEFMEAMGANQGEGFGRQLADLKTNYDNQMAIVKGNAEAEAELTKKYQSAKRDVYLSITSSMLGQAAGLFAKHTAAYKVLAIAGAVIDTYRSAVSAFNSFANIPVVGFGLGVAAAGLAVASGLKNVAAIAKVKVPGASDSSSVPSMPATSQGAPLTPQVGTTMLDQASINGVGNAAAGGANARAFVLESDVTDNQERITRLNRAARLGG